MGHFSYTCHLSGLPITGGTECVLLPLLPKRAFGAETSELKRFGVGSLVSNDGPELYFRELSFPIFGTYNDYGGLEKIQKDDNTEVLEKFFDLKIADIVEAILDGRKDQYKVDQIGEDAVKDEFGLSFIKAKLKLKKYPNQMFLVRASATWYRRDVYDNLIAKYKAGKQDYFDRLDIGVFGLLKSLGFKQGKDKTKGRYNTPFTKGDVTIYSDGNWIGDKPGENNNMQVYDLKGLKKWCAKKGVNIDIEKLDKLSYNAQIYKCILPGLKKLESHDRWNTERVLRMFLGDERLAHHTPEEVEDHKKSLEKTLKDKEKDPEAYAKRCKELGFDIVELYQKFVNDANKQCTLPLLYLEMAKEKGNDFLLKNIDDWNIFKSYYYPTGRFLYPVGTSAQDGEHERVLQLMEVAHECILKEVEEIRERNKEFEEDEEDEED